jgi:hypothetical protein
LIASNTRQRDLEKLALEIVKKNKKAMDAGGILYERLIELLQEFYSPEITPEDVIPLSGHFKRDGGEILIEVTARKFYIKRFELVHTDKEE